ncbi:hypothetical protein MJH12_18240, partial [bacterium]|nr:hypothetical protein [bacterium]
TILYKVHKMNPTALVYSSHNRCEYIHNQWIVERALQSHDNKTLLYLPWSESGDGGAFGTPQQFGWGKFEWYLNRFEQYGLKSEPFYYTDHMSREDAQNFFHKLATSEVVILGGGNSSLGLSRYKGVGERFFGDRDLFQRILNDRASRGKLTVGFSAGADQLCSILQSEIYSDLSDPVGFGLCHDIITTLHHEPQRDSELEHGAKKFPHCLIFGLPNDSGVAINQGFLPSGNIWQVIDFITDESWDISGEEFHIKTRQGAGIDHFYNDGRKWTFKGGDKMVRIIAPDSSWQDAWIFTAQGECYHYNNQERGNFSSVSEVLSHY